MYDREGFSAYFAKEANAAPNTLATYASFLNRIDAAAGGLDEMLDAKGAEVVAEWAKTTELEPFATYRSHARSVLKRYSLYRFQVASADDVGEEQSVVEQPSLQPIEADANFLREKEMQAQVRKQLANVEPGLVAIDDGKEAVVPTGRINILARDAQGRTVVIELKAGKCPPGALEQLLAYAYDVEQEQGGEVRAMLVAGSFTDRLRAAARRAGNVDLKTYAYSLNFTSED